MQCWQLPTIKVLSLGRKGGSGRQTFPKEQVFGHLPSQNSVAPTLSGKQVVVVQPQSLVTVEARYPSGQLTVELTQLQAHSYSSQHWVFRRVGVRCGGQEGGDSLLHSSFLQAHVKLGLHSPGLVRVIWRPPSQGGTNGTSQLDRSHTEARKERCPLRSQQGHSLL